MKNLPLYIPVVFIAATLLTLFFLYKATRNRKAILIISISWLAIQSAIGLSGFYTVADTMPPRFALLIIPPFILIAACFATEKGKTFLNSLNPKWLTILHTVRIPVELVLFWLFVQKYIPQLMTFEGRNLDIFSGLTAPVIFYLGYVRKVIGRNVLLAWNFICLALLANIVINAMLSAPFAFQQFAFDQPNRGVLYFPFVWLPCFVVPAVVLSHLASIRLLLKSKPYSPVVVQQPVTGYSTI
jgi:hypothetical protein